MHTHTRLSSDILIFPQNSFFIFYLFIYFIYFYFFTETNRAMFDARILHKQKAFSEEEQLPDDGSGGLSVSSRKIRFFFISYENKSSLCGLSIY